MRDALDMILRWRDGENDRTKLALPRDDGKPDFGYGAHASPQLATI
jgi:hypothetical protein